MKKIVDEMEWWDRLAMAVDLLEARAAAGRRDLSGLLPPGVTGHVYEGVTDTETLRRLTQMPDETPHDLLVRPFSVYCPEIKTFVSVNDPSTPLQEHLKNIEEIKP